MNPLVIIEYIRSTVDILMNMRGKGDETSHSNKSLKPESERLKDYEKMLQAAEEDLREHIRVCHIKKYR